MSHFSIKELTNSSVATAKGISNVPDAKALSNLMYVITQLEAIRSLLGDNSITVSSGYRCKALNAAVGGVATSAHVDGLAVDFTCVGFGNTVRVVEAIYKSGIDYDQLILEYPNKPTSWVHIGFAPQGTKPRKQCLITTTGTYKAYTP